MTIFAFLQEKLSSQQNATQEDHNFYASSQLNWMKQIAAELTPRTVDKPAGLGLWEVTLSEGDLLYIPAGFYHSTVAGFDSVSINAWLPSTLSEVSVYFSFHTFTTTTPSIALQLFKSLVSIELPFFRTDETPLKLANTAAVIRDVLLSLSSEGTEKDCAQINNGGEGARMFCFYSLSAFSASMRSRYESQVSLFDQREPVTCHPTYRFHSGQVSHGLAAKQSISYLSVFSLHIADTSLVVRRVSSTLKSYLSFGRLSAALNSVLLMDYIDEILSLILRQEAENAMKGIVEDDGGAAVNLTPLFMIRFLENCLDTII